MPDFVPPEDRFEELLSAYLDGSAGEADVGELTGMLRGSPERQRVAARLFLQHGALAWILRGAGASAPALPGAPRRAVRSWWIAVPVAASLLVALFVARWSPGPGDAGLRTLEFQDGASPASSYVGTRDARLSDKDLAVNRGSDSFIEVESSSEPGGKPTLLRWDLREIPQGSRVAAVTIALSMASVSREEAYVVHGLRRPWVEREATWLEYAAGKPWDAPGGKGPGDRDAAVLARFVPARGPFAFGLNSDGVAAVQRWVDAPDSNHGFIFLSTSAQGEFYAHSRESEPPTIRPKIAVTFRTPAR